MGLAAPRCTIARARLATAKADPAACKRDAHFHRRERRIMPVLGLRTWPIRTGLSTPRSCHSAAAIAAWAPPVDADEGRTPLDCEVRIHGEYGRSASGRKMASSTPPAGGSTPTPPQYSSRRRNGRYSSNTDRRTRHDAARPISIGPTAIRIGPGHRIRKCITAASQVLNVTRPRTSSCPSGIPPRRSPCRVPPLR